jgi:hypothetical protein
MWKYQGEQSGILSMSHLWCNASPTPFEGKVLEVYRAAFIVAFLLHLPYTTLRYGRWCSASSTPFAGPEDVLLLVNLHNLQVLRCTGLPAVHCSICTFTGTEDALFYLWCSAFPTSFAGTENVLVLQRFTYTIRRN